MIKISSMEFNPNWWKDVTFPTGLNKEQLTQPTWFNRLKSGQIIKTSLGEEYMYGQYGGDVDLPAASPIYITTEMDDNTDVYTFMPGSDDYYMGRTVMDVKPQQWCIVQKVMPTLNDTSIGDYNTLSNKPLINGCTLQGNQNGPYYGISNIYYLDNILPLSDLQTGYDMLGATIDFSGLSEASFEGISDQYGSIERADISSPPTSYWFILCQRGKGQSKFTITVNASQVRQSGAPLNGQTVCTYDPTDGEFAWDESFSSNKTWQFTEFTDLPTHTSVVGSYRDDELATLWSDIKVTSGNERLSVDCEFLHGQLGQVTSSIGELNSELALTNANVTELDGRITSINVKVTHLDSVVMQQEGQIIQQAADIASLGTTVTSQGTSIAALQTQKSDIYTLEPTISLRELQVGYNLLGATIDFSMITEALFLSPNIYLELERANIYSGGNTYYDFLWIHSSEDGHAVYVHVDCTWSSSGWPPGMPTLVCTYSFTTNTLTWDPGFVSAHKDKKYTFTSFAQYPDMVNLSGVYEYGDDGGFLDAIKITSGNDRLGVDCEFLHDQLTTLTTSMSEDWVKLLGQVPIEISVPIGRAWDTTPVYNVGQQAFAISTVMFQSSPLTVIQGPYRSSYVYAWFKDTTNLTIGQSVYYVVPPFAPAQGLKGAWVEPFDPDNPNRPYAGVTVNIPSSVAGVCFNWIRVS